MADHFLSSLQNIKQSFSLSDIDFEFMNNFPGLIPNQQLMGFHQDSFYPGENFEQALITSQTNTSVSHVTDQMVSDYSDSKDRKRKSMDICTPESSSVYSSPQGSENGTTKNVGGKGKRMKGNGKDAEKPREVVHVRAKRGQATDSHSLAERARRGKINERLRCLQDIVPGCCKTMGMAVMLDEIINYVQSLQNQVEFLSLKLTAASTLQDMNSNTNLIENLQRAKALEALKIQNALGLGNQGISSAQFAQLDLNFGFFPQLPHNL